MADDEQKLLEEAKKLHISERVAHSNWKVRSAAYDDVKTGCERAMSSDDPCLDGYVSIFSKAVADTNAAAADKALDALQAFLGIATEQHAARIVEKTCGNMVNKCLGARPGTVARATAAMMLFVELEQADKVSESLIAGFSHKVPKVVNAALEALLGAVRAFGARVMPPQPILKSLPPLFDSKDAKARATTKELVAELARWVGPELVRSMLFEKMRDAMKEDVEKLLQETGTARPQPERFTRKEMARRAAAEASAAAKAAEAGDEAAGGGPEPMEEDTPPEVDAYEFAEPKDILTELKKDWWELLESKKWSERKQALTTLKELAAYPKLLPGDYGDVNREMKKIITKDSNLAVAAEAVACTGELAKGLRNAYSNAAKNFCPALLEKFKEKNTIINKNTMEALTLMLKYSFTVLDVQEDIVAALGHANPRVREETLKLLETSLEQETKQTLSKLVPTVLPAAAGNADEATPSLREAALKYLVTFAVKFGSVAVLDKVTAKMDDTRKKKLEELVDAARKTSRPGAAAPAARAAPPPPAASAPPSRAAKLMTAPANLSAPAREPISGPPASRPPSRPKPAASKPATGGASKASGGGGGGGDDDANVGQGLSKDEAIQQLSDIVGESVVAKLSDAQWKIRLEAMEGIVNQAPGLIQHCSVLIQALAYVPGSDERNFQVTAKHFEVIRIMASEAETFSKKDAFASIGILVEKVADIKLKNPSFEALFAIGEAVGPGFVCTHLHKKAAAHKNPKVLVESINWMTQAIDAFGLPAFNVKNLLDWMKEDLGSAQATIRTAAINLLGTMHKFVGRPMLDMLGGDMKPALMTQIEDACSKNPVQSGFTPTRIARTATKKAAASSGKGGGSSGGGGGGGRGDSGPAPTVSMDLDSMLPRTDISDQLTSSLMSSLMSANWKDRKAALDSLDDILKCAGGRIQPQVGELFSVLKHRMSDSNKNLAIQTLHLVGKLAGALGKHIDRVGRCVLTPGLKNMSDSKALVRAAVWDMMEAWAAAASVEPLVSDTVDVMADAKCSADGKKDAVTWMLAQVTAGKTGDCLVDVMKAVSIGSQAKESQVREATSKLVAELVKVHGVGAISQACSQLEGPHKKAAMEAVTKATGAAVPSALMTAPAAPVSTRPAASAGSSASRATSASRGVSSSASSKLKTTGGRGAVSSSNASKLHTGPASLQTQSDDGPLVMLDTKKDERAKRAKFKSAKFEIQPDEAEIVQEQLSRVVSPSMKVLLFHKDFKKHCEAADLMRENMGSLQDNILSCVDLIFRWTVLRIVEANTQSIVAVLALLKSIFDVMIEREMRLSDYEAKVLLPCLVEKCGHNNDRIKADFRELLRKACELYSPMKVFTLVRDGLESKNNRTKVECADELGQIIDRVGAKVYANPKQHEVLQTLAKMVSERDGAVRKAVLGAMEVFYSFESDGIWSYLGRLSEQQRNLIEERLKYVDKELAKKGLVAGYRKPVEAPAPTPMDVDIPPYTAPVNPIHTAPAANGYGSRPQSNGNHIPRPQSSLNPTMLQTGGNISNPMVWSTNLTNGPAHPSELQTAQVTNALHTFASPAAIKLSEDELQDELGRCLNILAGSNINDVVEVMKMLCYQLMEFDRLSQRSLQLFISHVDRLVHLLAMKTDMIFSLASACVSSGTPPNSRACKYSLNSLMQIFQNPSLGVHVTETSMMELMSVLLLRLLDEKLPKLPEGDALLKALNVLMLKILENTDRDNAFGALLLLLLTPHSSLVNSPDRLTREPRWNDLVVKCLIKITKALPQTIETSNLNRLLLNIHNFFDRLGQDEIRARGARDDRPLRMVKTLLHELCKLKGYDIYKYLDSIPQKDPRPIIFPYIDLNLQTLVSSGIIQPNNDRGAAHATQQVHSRSFPAMSNGSTGSTMSHHSTATAHRHPTSSLQEARNVLATIFKRIGDKNEPDKALTELHFFLLEHPEIDINQYLSAASEQFRMFINKGLTRIRTNLANRAEQQHQPVAGHHPANSIGDLRDRIAARQAAMGQMDSGVSQPSMMDLQERMERMRRLRGEVA